MFLSSGDARYLSFSWWLHMHPSRIYEIPIENAWVIFGTKAIVEHALLKKTCTSLCKARLQDEMKALVLRGIHLLWSPKRLQWHEYMAPRNYYYFFIVFQITFSFSDFFQIFFQITFSNQIFFQIFFQITFSIQIFFQIFFRCFFRLLFQTRFFFRFFFRLLFQTRFFFTFQIRFFSEINYF